MVTVAYWFSSYWYHSLLLSIVLFPLTLVPSFTAAQSDEVDASSGSSQSSSPITPDTDGDEYEEEVVEEVEAEPQMYVMPAQDVQTYVKFLGVTDNSQAHTDKERETQREKIWHKNEILF